MTRILVVLIASPLLVIADAVYDEFLRLKQKGSEEWVTFYHSVSNDMAELKNGWNEERELFAIFRNDGSMSNVVYDVDLINVSTNVISTNLTQVSQRFLNGEVYRYTYDKSGRISLIEHELPRRGDFKCYEVGTNEDLECYYSMTNFVGEHGLMMYRNGQLTEVGGVPDFSNLRE